jgi:hypothetical protein
MYLNLTIEIDPNWLGITKLPELPAILHIDWLRI